MKFLRNHWFDIGGVAGFGILCVVVTGRGSFSAYQIAVLCNLAALLLHQFEEYRLPGTFPGMVNRVMFNSSTPDRYPLNSNTAVVVNVYVGWMVYLLAIIAGDRAVWLGIATVVVSVGNIIAHTLLFTWKSGSWYNAGLVTCWLCLAPSTVVYIAAVYSHSLATTPALLTGLLVGIGINIVGVYKPISWLADSDSVHRFTWKQTR